MKQLQISDTFSLPPEAVTETFLVLGQRGSGKTNTAAVIAEELFSCGAPFAVLTPIDVWWGLKSSADGQGPGLAIYIFGGDHGDIPLKPTDGRLMADILIEERISCVICTQGFSGRERAMFVKDFALRLLSKNREPLHLIVEEADAFIPQKPYAGEEEMLGAMDRLIRWGRSPSAIGGTFLTQRSAKINKDISTQCSVLVAHRTSGPQDIVAIREWFKHHSDPERQRQVLSEISSLPKGMAFLYSPAWLEHFGKHQIRRRSTFDSAATPKLGARRMDPAAVVMDLKILEIRMAENIEKFKAEDPKELRKQIATLTAELKKADASRNLQKPAEPKIVEISVLTDADRSLLETCSFGVTSLAAKAEAVLGLFNALMKEVISKGQPFQDQLGRQMGATFPVVSTVVPGNMKAKVSDQHRDHRANGAGTLSKAELRLLTVLAQYPNGKELKSLAHLAGYTVNGHFNNTLGSLRSRGLAQAGNPVVITNLGMDTIGDDFEPLPAGEALRQYWLNKVGGSERRILNVLINLYPEGATPGGLALASGYTVNGHFNNMLGSLRTAGVVERGVPIKASSTLFE